MSSIYDFEPKGVKNFLRQNQVRKVALQMPSGLRPYLKEIERVFREENCETYILASSCYGACDIADEDARDLGCDALVHYGHSDIGIPTSIPTLYVEARMNVEPFEALDKVLPELQASVWGLTSTIQHVHWLEEIQDFLEEKGIKSLIGEPGSRCKYPGQILGCGWGSGHSVEEEVDGFVYIGTGDFHPLGLSLATDNPVIAVNPISNSNENIDQEKETFLRKRAALLSKAKSAEFLGILTSTKKGQNRLKMGKNLAKKLEKAGYRTFVLVTDDLTPEILKDYRLDAYVNTACPRIPLSDEKRYDEPILTPFEARVLAGEEEWEPYHLDEIGINF